MMIHQFLEEYDNLSEERKKAGLKRLFDEIMRDPTQYEDFIDDVLRSAADAEANDYFGTEGLDV